MKIHHGSLFSGIGGFDLAAAALGWSNLFSCENNPFAQRVLKYHFPKSDHYDDIKKTNFVGYNGMVDVLSGGFPCQPFSQAGKRKGTDDDRHLWPEFLRVIRETRPTFVVGENVRGLLTIANGTVFDDICGNLENEGFEVWPYLLPASAIGAPHQRYRIFIVAHSAGNRRERGRTRTKIEGRRQPRSGEAGELARRFEGFRIYGNAADADGELFEGRRDAIRSETTNGYVSLCDSWSNGETWRNFPSQQPVCRGNDGFPGQLDGITFPKWRNESIKAYGNAVVPPLVFQIFKSIEQFLIQTE